MSKDLRRGVGSLGETVAAELFERLGYTVLDRNFRTREGELDLVASRDGTLVFCEVKTLVARSGGPSAGPSSPLEAIGPAKRLKVRRMARAWLAAQGGAAGRDLRLDVVGVLLSPAGEPLHVEHVEGAF